MQGTYTELFFTELKTLLLTLVNSSLLALVKKGSKSSYLLSSQEDWGRGREQGARFEAWHMNRKQVCWFSVLNSENICLHDSKRPLGVPNPSVPHVWYPILFLPRVLCAVWLGEANNFSVHADWTSPLLFSLAVNASGNTYRKKLALLLPLTHVVWAYRISHLQGSLSSSILNLLLF